MKEREKKFHSTGNSRRTYPGKCGDERWDCKKLNRIYLVPRKFSETNACL